MNQNALCKLCGKKAKLIKKSHIIPKFMYDGIRGDDNGMIMKDFNSNSRYENWPSGIHERYILCEDCDNRVLGKYENYVASFFNGKLTKSNKVKVRLTHDPNGLADSALISELDYRAFKLCFISILWRAHISQNKFFSYIDCESLEKKMRQLILANEVPKESDFKLAIICVQGQDGQPVQFAINPNILESEGYKVALFFVGGYLYFLELVENSNYEFITPEYLKENGDLTIRIIRGELARSMLETLKTPAEWLEVFTPK